MGGFSGLVSRRTGRVLLWGAAPPFSLEGLAETLRRQGEPILAAADRSLAFAFPEWTGPRRVIPRRILTERGRWVREPWALPWLLRFGYEEPRAEWEGETPDGRPVSGWVRDLDLEAVELYLLGPEPLRCTDGVLLRPGPAVRVRAPAEADAWAAAWAWAVLADEARRAFEALVREAERQGRPWMAAYREQEGRFDPESRLRIWEAWLLPRAVRPLYLEAPDFEALAAVGKDLPTAALDAGPGEG